MTDDVLCCFVESDCIKKLQGRLQRLQIEIKTKANVTGDIFAHNMAIKRY